MFSKPLLLVLAFLLPFIFNKARANREIAYVTNTDASTVTIIDVSSQRAIGTIAVGSIPSPIVLIPNRQQLYIGSIIGIGGSIDIVDINTQKIVGTVAVGTYPRAIAITPNGNEAYVVNNSGHSVNVIDAVTKTIVATIPVGSTPNGIAITSNGTKVYVTNGFVDSVSVIDTSSKIVVATVSVGSLPLGIGITPDGKDIYVLNYRDNNATIIDTATTTAVGVIGVGDGPSYVAFASMPSPTPPPVALDVRGIGEKNAFLTQASFFNEISWSSPSTQVTNYEIYRDKERTQLIVILPSSETSYRDHNRRKGRTYTYFVIGKVNGTVVASGDVALILE